MSVTTYPGYGVALVSIGKRGLIERTALVCQPHNGNWNYVCSGTEQYARDLLASMRRAESKYGVPYRASSYIMVPLPVAFN